ncbi:MAG: ligase-associated DNA damage response endonuclease PdeM [Minwuia sp.]|nr:ligase-associated DNA damage response endonuclease PdeM [Minwuia sp.]
MTTTEMVVNGARLQPDPSGAVWWPAEGMLIVSDLHFEKGSAMARRGHGLLPPYDTATTLTRLEALLQHYRPARLLALGDSFHDRHAFSRLSANETDRLAALSQRQEMIWITGNHDPEPPDSIGGRILETYPCGPLLFRHEPVVGRAPGEVAGHLHPKARIRGRGRQVRARCFATDGLRLIVPAFGAYTGGLDVMDAAFRPLFPKMFHAWMMTGDRVLPVRSDRLVAAVA